MTNPKPIFKKQNSFKQGHSFEIDVIDYYNNVLGENVELETNRNKQIHSGDTKCGKEIKRDRKSLETGNLAIEVVGSSIHQYSDGPDWKPTTMWRFPEGFGKGLPKHWHMTGPFKKNVKEYVIGAPGEYLFEIKANVLRDFIIHDFTRDDKLNQVVKSFKTSNENNIYLYCIPVEYVENNLAKRVFDLSYNASD